MAKRVATITARPGLRPDTVMYHIAYTKSGRPAGGSLARPDEIEEWKTGLAAAGWAIVDTTQPEPAAPEPLDLDEVERLHQERVVDSEADDARAIDEYIPQLIAELRAARAELDRRDQADAETLVDQTLIRELTVKDGKLSLDLIPPHEIALLFVHAAKGVLGDAPNYSETPVDFPREAVSMEVKAAGEYDSYVLTVQRKGKLTPHEARQRAERRAQEAESREEQAITDRDNCHDLLDKFAYKVAPAEVIGEHTSANDPWANALERLTPAAEVDRLRAQLAAPLHFTATRFGAVRDDETGNVTVNIATARGPVRIDLTEDLAEALGLVLLDDPEHSDGTVQPAPSGGCTCDTTDGPCPACHPNPLNGER